MAGPSARGIPMVAFVGTASVVSFLAITLSLFFVSRHYSQKAVTDLELTLRERLPLEIGNALEQKLGLVPRFMKTTLNLVQGRDIDLQTWEGHMYVRDIFVSYLRTFPGESRCCSALLTIPKEANGLATPGPNNNFTIWNVVLLRPDGIDWWFNRSDVGPSVSVCTWNLYNKTATEYGVLGKDDLAGVIVPWFGPDPYATEPIYTPAIIWMLDEVQLKVHVTLPLRHPVTNDWIGTYVAGFKLGFMSRFLADTISNLPSWLIFLVDGCEANNGVLLATSIPDYLVLSCFTDASRCTVPGVANCHVCGPNENTAKVHAVDTPDSLVRGVAQHLAPADDWRGLVKVTQALTFSVGGTRYLVSTWGVHSYGLSWVGVVVVPYTEIFGTLQEGEKITSIIASVLIVVGIVTLLFITVSITRPVKKLSLKLWEVSHMELDTDIDLANEFILAGFIKEFAICFASFKVMVGQLKEYRSFMPQSILVASEDDTADEDTNTSAQMRQTSSHHTNDETSTLRSQQTSVMRKKQNVHLAIGAMAQGHYAILSISFPSVPPVHEKDHIEMTTISKHYVAVIIEACHCTRGLPEFSDGLNIMVSFGVSMKCSSVEERASDAALMIMKKLSGVVLGASSGRGLIGTLGNESMRKVAAVGNVYDQALYHRELNRHVNTRVLVDDQTQKVCQYNFILDPVDIITDVETNKRRYLYTLVARKVEGEQQEWMYQLEAGTDNTVVDMWDSFSKNSPPYPEILEAISNNSTTGISLRRLKMLASSKDGSTYSACMQFSDQVSDRD